MRQLIDGYRRFRGNHWPEYRDLYRELSRYGQKPPTLIIACSDSRVDPGSIFDAQPGEIFVVRNVANLVPPYEEGDGLHGTSAAIEFAVKVLNVDMILVLGHGDCGGVSAALKGDPLGDSEFLAKWIELINPARAKLAHLDPADPAAKEALECESIKLSIERLMTFPFVAAAVAAGGLVLEGARFRVFDGRLEWLDKTTGEFSRVE
ncbi:carbonic anhydrase [Oleomonas cavernae]|uniref:Carbonic anhydrase n=1 Tax=Oleomonas cavernae TaxID=2320859 RepID=A0A418WD51_9PROT|nr:carbonic anhydrase [Oleomonas cavernae]RJF87952.1 carbonic anhydrase [Oleomonas cavernae]